MPETNRDFKGVWIPKEVWLDTRLNALDKIILTEIDSLDQGDRGCYASNEYIAAFCQCSERKVSAAISKLIEYGYINVQSFDGRQRELRSSLTKNARLPSKICEAEEQNLLESNINNNTANKTKRVRAASRFTPPTVDEVRAYCQERKNNVDPERFVDYYTSNGWKVGKNPMKDWKAAVRTWERHGWNGYGYGGQQKQSKPNPSSPDAYSTERLLELLDENE